jgi:hypothetical protein
MLRRLALVRTDVSEELSATFVSVTRIGELGTTLAVTSNRRTLLRLLVAASVVSSSPIRVTLTKEALSYSETSALTRATRRDIPEDTILSSYILYYQAPALHETACDFFQCQTLVNVEAFLSWSTKQFTRVYGPASDNFCSREGNVGHTC